MFGGGNARLTLEDAVRPRRGQTRASDEDDDLYEEVPEEEEKRHFWNVFTLIYA